MFESSDREQEELYALYSSRCPGGEQRSSGLKKRKTRSKVADRMTSFYDDDSDDDAGSRSYFAMGSGEASDAQLRRALAMMTGGHDLSQKQGTSGIQTNVNCQNCGEVGGRLKRLQCSHVICRKCAMRLRREHLDPGQWMLRCLTCNLITTWYGNKLEGLHDVKAVQDHTKRPVGIPRNNGVVQEKEGQITMYGDKDLTINIVSFAKEKAETKKALESAGKKMKLCNQQMKLIKEREKKANDAKMKLRKQMKRASDGMITAIRSHRATMLEELDEMFQIELKPLQDVKTAVEEQMRNLKLVTQCCSVANRILENGGAPLDLDNFKQTVWQTMGKTNVVEMPESLTKSYKTNIIFKSNEIHFDKLAEKIGELQLQKQQNKEKAVKKEAATIKEKPRVPTPPSSDDEEIYDLPPELEEKMNRVMSRMQDDELYDEIPFSSQLLTEGECFAAETPPPIPKKPQSETDDLNLPPSLSADMLPQDFGASVQHSQVAQSNFGASSSFSSDATDDDDANRFKPTSTARSRIGSSRSRASGYRSARESRSRPGSPVLHARRRSYGVQQNIDDDDCFEYGSNCKYATSSGYEAQPDYQAGTFSGLMKRRKSLKALGSLTSHVQQFLGKSESAPLGLNAERLLFCLGKMKKPGVGGSLVQPFNSPPEMALSEDDTVWIADSASSRIQIHEGVQGRVVGSFKTTLQGVALKPRGVTTLSGGRKVAVSCGRFATVWSEGGELLRQVGPHSDFGKLGGLARDSGGNLILSDIENNRIVFTGSGKIIYDAVIGSCNSGKSPWLGRIAVNKFDQVICPDYGAHCVRIYNSAGHFMSKFGGFGVGHGQFRYPSAVAVDSRNRIYVADECNNRVSLFSPDGEDCLGHVVTKDDGLVFPHAVCVFSDGAVAVADDNKVVKVYRGED